jgi:hypothetical protein
MILPLVLLFASFSSPAPIAANAASASIPENPETVAEYVGDYYADTPILADIAWCESRNRQWNPDGSVFRGAVNHYDVGIMQINSLYHEDTAKDLGLDIYSLGGNLAYAKYLYDKEGTQPWSSSEACWGKKVAVK